MLEIVCSQKRSRNKGFPRRSTRLAVARGASPAKSAMAFPGCWERRGHYVSRQGGSRMLVLERRRGERLRINGTAEIVILEVHAEYVKITIESSPDNAAKLQR